MTTQERKLIFDFLGKDEELHISANFIYDKGQEPYWETDNVETIEDFYDAEEAARTELVENPNLIHELGWRYHDFDRDWYTLMQVVEKIESLFPDTDPPVVIISQGMCEIEHHDFVKDCDGRTRQSMHEGRTKLEATYKMVVEFIQWYNQQEK